MFGILGRLVTDFVRRPLDMDPDFGRYWNFCGTIIDLCTDSNPYKSGIQHHIIQRRCSVDKFYFKSYVLVEDILVPQKY